MKHRVLFCFLILLTAFSCTNEDVVPDSTHGADILFNTDTKLIRLKGDSTNMAGSFRFRADVPEVFLKWNVTGKSNLDTSLVRLTPVNGEFMLPVKWDKSIDGKYAPEGVAFDAGVLITAGEEAKYVHLVWAEKCDSLKIMQNSHFSTRADSEVVMPLADEITFTPPVLVLDKTIGGDMEVRFKNETAGGKIIYPVELGNYFDMSADNLPTRITKGTVLKFRWKGALPTESILFPISVSNSDGITGTGYIQFTPSDIVWTYTGSKPATTEMLPATGATVKIFAATNDKWEVSCSDATPEKVEGEASALGNKDLTLHINDNPGETARQITVGISNGGTVKKTLVFTQAGKASSLLTYINSNLPSLIPYVGGKYTFDFDGTYEGNLEIRAMITTPDGDTGFVRGTAVTTKHPTIIIPENTIVGSLDIEFQYRTDGKWIPIEYRLQEPAPITATPGIITPMYDPMPDFDMTYYCTFTGNYTGKIGFRARRDDDIFVGTEGTVGEELKLMVPATTLRKTSTVYFEYTIDGGATWQPIESRKQNFETFTISPVTPVRNDIPAKGGEYSVTIGGTYSGFVTFRAIDKDKKELASDRNKIINGKETILKVMIPANTGPSRSVTFLYSLNDGEKWQVMEMKRQDPGNY